MPRLWTFLASLFLVLGASGCSDNPEPRTADAVEDPCKPDARAEHAAETAGAAVETGGTTAWEGMKTFGESVGGLVSGGPEEAKKKWKQGEKKTGDTARKGGKETRATAESAPCQEQ
jgi:hypothetical protein